MIYHNITISNIQDDMYTDITITIYIFYIAQSYIKPNRTNNKSPCFQICPQSVLLNGHLHNILNSMLFITLETNEYHSTTERPHRFPERPGNLTHRRMPRRFCIENSTKLELINWYTWEQLTLRGWYFCYWIQKGNFEWLHFYFSS